MNEEKNEFEEVFVINKLELYPFINTLIDLYERGATFIDIVAMDHKEDVHQQAIDIIAWEVYPEEDTPPLSSIGISDENLNDLI